MAASRTGVRRAASASAAGAGHESADTAAGRSLSRCRSRGVATPTATAPHASVRRTRVLRKAAPAYPQVVRGTRERGAAVLLGAELEERVSLGHRRRVGCPTDVLADPLRCAPRGLVRAGLVFADSDGHAAVTT